MATKPVTSLSVTYNVALITVDNIPVDYKLISDIFKAIAAEQINVDMISQAPPYKGKISLSFTIPSEDVVKAIGILHKYKDNIPNLVVEVDSQNTKLSIYGDEMKNLPGVAAGIFTLMAENGVEIKLVTTSEVDISYLIYDKDVDLAIQEIKKHYHI